MQIWWFFWMPKRFSSIGRFYDFLGFYLLFVLLILSQVFSVIWLRFLQRCLHCREMKFWLYRSIVSPKKLWYVIFCIVKSRSRFSTHKHFAHVHGSLEISLRRVVILSHVNSAFLWQCTNFIWVASFKSKRVVFQRSVEILTQRLNKIVLISAISRKSLLERRFLE